SRRTFAGSWLPEENDPAARVVVNAITPSSAKPGTSTRLALPASSATDSRRTRLPRLPADVRPQRVQSLVYALITALDLSHVVYHALPVCTQRGNEHRHSSTNVRRLHRSSAQRRRTGNDHPVRVAHDYPG